MSDRWGSVVLYIEELNVLWIPPTPHKNRRKSTEDARRLSEELAMSGYSNSQSKRQNKKVVPSPRLKRKGYASSSYLSVLVWPENHCAWAVRFRDNPCPSTIGADWVRRAYPASLLNAYLILSLVVDVQLAPVSGGMFPKQLSGRYSLAFQELKSCRGGDYLAQFKEHRVYVLLLLTVIHVTL
jgi:hypothetical protein